MPETINAVYENGVFRPEVPPDLPDGSAVRLSIVTPPPEPKTPLTGPELLALISKSWKKFNPNTDRPQVTSENVDQILYGSGGSGGPGDVR
ncbi:MAG: antitoxin family protein [Gemmataceae bacterium]